MYSLQEFTLIRSIAAVAGCLIFPSSIAAALRCSFAFFTLLRSACLISER